MSLALILLDMPAFGLDEILVHNIVTSINVE